MIPKYLSEMWTAVAPAIGNHLWQSTLFAVVAGVLTLILRKNRARARYGLWLAASLKFLIPFSLLVKIGSYVGWWHAAVRATGGFYYAMEQAGQPFATPAISYATPSTVSASTSVMNPLPAALATAWLCGFVALLFIWCVRWRRMSGVVREAVLLREGREVEVLRRLERVAGIRGKIEILLSRDSLEPAVFGIFRPVLVWPHGISKRLDNKQVEAVIAHELCHLRRRDNLSAAMHMVVKAIFWFHPLAWWLGARLAEERECACDEEVLELGSERELYAESILKVCEFCVGSRLSCVAGVTGADLKKRIVRIMTGRVALKLDFGRKLLLCVAGLAVIAAPIVFGQVRAAQSQPGAQANATTGNVPSEVFDVASIKLNNPIGGHFMFGGGWSPDGFTSYGATLHELVRMAYGVQDSQISGGSNWVNSERYEVQAKMSASVVDNLRKLSPDQRELVEKHMLQALLADRFRLVIRHEIKELPVYALVMTKNGPKLQAANPANTYAGGFKAPDGSSAGPNVMEFGGGGLTGQGVPISVLVQELSQQPELAGRTVIDRTGLADTYDFKLKWTPGNSMSNSMPVSGNAPPPDSSGLSLFTALQEQLGLKLESTKGPVDTLVIDHVERPSGN